MKKTHGFTIILLLLALPVVLAACQSRPVPIPLSDKKEISVVIDDNYPPYSFRDSSGNLQGISIDQWRLWEKITGIKVHITGTDWEKALNEIEKKQYDVIDTIFYNDIRAKIFDFSKPYADIKTPIYFNNDISGINNIDSLKGFTVAVKSGDAVAAVLKARGIENIVEYNSYQAIVQAAARHEVVVFVIDQPPAGYYLYQYKIESKFNQTDPVSSGQFHRAVLKGNTQLLAVINAGFENISPAQIQSIDRKWFGLPVFNSTYLKDGAYILAAILLLLIGLMLWNHTLQVRVYQKTKNLAESESRFHSLFEQSPISLWEEDFSAVRKEINTLIGNGVTDLSQYLQDHPERVMRLFSLIKVNDVNRATVEMFGAQNKAELLSSLSDVLQKTPPNSLINELVHIQSGNLDFKAETINNTLDNRLLSLELSWTVVPGYEKDMSNVIVSLVDITERKKVEAEIKNLNQELEERIHRRTLELERSNQELESFSYSVSHDLRAPLRAINGYTQIIMNDHVTKVDAEVLRYLEAISKNAIMMGELIDELLDFSRLGKKSLTLMTVSPDSLIQSILEELKPEIKGRDIEFILHPLPDVKADAVLLKEVLQNLISNSVKFTRKVSHAVIEIGTTRSKPCYPCGEEVRERDCIYVHDNGVGFNMNYYDKLFNMFQRLHSADDYEGSGVGLALAKRIINKHGGSIWAESEVGKGTTFYFTLGQPQDNTWNDVTI